MYEVLKTEFSNRSRSYKALIEMEIIHYFIDFIRDNPELTPIKDETAIHKSSKYQTIYNIADYISDHYAESISLDGLAGVFYLSKFYLSRSFKEVTGYGVNEYVNILRTKRAKQLLEETTLSVSEIAGTVGYESITYFEKVFKILHEYFTVKVSQNPKRNYLQKQDYSRSPKTVGSHSLSAGM